MTVKEDLNLLSWFLLSDFKIGGTNEAVRYNKNKHKSICTHSK